MRLRTSAGRIARIRTTSTRPNIAQSLLEGRSRAEICAAVPALFSICARSQAAASELACAAAAGEALTADNLTRCADAVSAEMVRENAWRTLLEWPRWIAEPPSDGAVAAARASLQYQCDASADDRARGDAIGNAVFGTAADAWLAMASSLPELERWTAAGHTAAARFIGSVLDDHTAERAKNAHAHAEPSVDAAAQTQLLDGRDPAAWLAEISRACDADADFARRPTWRGAPAETGALARQRSDPLIAELMRNSTTRAAARFVARLRELALLLTGRSPASVGAQTLPSGHGVAWVDNARGLLMHQVLLERQIARRYRVVAPTDWNFHPDGALASALLGAPARDLTAVKQHAQHLVHSLDACVACRVEIEDA